MDNFKKDKARWKAFLKNHDLKQKDAARMLGYENTRMLAHAIATAKSRSRPFPSFLTKLMNFMEAWEANDRESTSR